MTNDSVGSLKNYEFIGTTYIGEISRGDGTYTTTIPDASGGLNLGYYWSDDYVWRNFESGPDCSEPVHVVPVVSEALGKGLTAEDLVGMNATIGMRIVLFGPTPDSPYVDFADYNYEEMYQVWSMLPVSIVTGSAKARGSDGLTTRLKTVRIHYFHR